MAGTNLTDGELKKYYERHTTGYGRSGFRSAAYTPELSDAVCEVCHGPVSLHALSANPKDIKDKLTEDDCENCHNSDRVTAFKCRPVVYGGGY